MTIDQVLQWHYPMPLSPSFCVCLAHYPCATIAAVNKARVTVAADA